MNKRCGKAALAGMVASSMGRFVKRATYGLRTSSFGFLMMALLSALALATPRASSGADNGTVTYEMAPEMHDAKLVALRIRMSFRSAPDGQDGFGWQGSWQGDQRLWRWARDVRIAGARNVTSDSPGHWRIASDPGTDIVVSYRIVSAYDADPTVSDSEQTKPVIRPTWFYAAGEALFGRPDGREKAPATFDWRPGDAGIRFASDLEHLRGAGGQRGTVADVLESISIGGEQLDVRRDPHSGVRIATLGSYGFDLPSFRRVTGRIISAERRFWRAKGSSPYLVAMVPLASVPAQSSYGGTGRTDGFALWVDRAAPLEAIKWLLAHEYFHTWNPVRLGGRPSSREARQELMWFTEGFTDYYARALLVRSGVITPQDFVKQWNAVLLAYAMSPARAEPNRSAARRSAEGEPFERLPYQRGALLAAVWNERLAELSKGRTNLDDILLEQRRRARIDGPDPAAAFVQTGRRYGLNVTEDIERHVDHGDPIRLPPDIFGPCATVSNVQRPAFSRGFDAEATAQAGNVVHGVDPSSTAYAAGLRNGMRIVGREAGETGNPLVEYALAVEDAQVRRTIRYMPQARTTVAVQEITLRQPVGAGCGRSLGGLRRSDK